MGLDITFKAGEDTLSFRLSKNDVEVCAFLSKKGFEREIDIIFDVSDFGDIVSVNHGDLLKSINKLLVKINDDPGLLPYTYVVKQEFPHGSGSYYSGTGSISGFVVNGERFSIEGGLDHCALYKLNQNKSGDYTCDFDNPIDIRDKKMIKIDDECRDVGGLVFGDIIIEKKKRPTKLVKNLKQLQSFLSRLDTKVIQKVLG
jgi:hypothetical protein